ncbi:MBL fold metallo-hydrolase [Aquimarina aggregata]|uniref:MBL fold metallo-hydrolase n=1 Tax=Aquimarina aggregata TaxID=1642818 RepID=UPI0024921017|nr:MBL fold metallo-hydrolase [Aquimarina aggregata]
MKAIVKTFKVENSFIKNQCYLVYNQEQGILVDPAWEYDTIADFIFDKNIILKAILLTHAHSDHTNLVERFTKNNTVPVYMSGIEIENYEFNTPNLKPITHLSKISIGDFDIIPIITPGHTLGSTCYLIESHLFSGDTVFIEGVGICNRIDCYRLYDSVQFLKSFLNPNTLFWPGHSFGESPGKDLDYLMKNNIYFQFNDREHFVNFRTRKNRPNPFSFE